MFNKGVGDCFTTNDECTFGAANMTCSCFLALSRCLDGAVLDAQTKCATAPSFFTDKVGLCVKYSRCTQKQCRALVTGVDDVSDTTTNLAFVAPIVVVGVLLFALGVAVVDLVVRKRQRAEQVQAAAAQEAVIAGLGLGKPSAPPPEPEPEFLQELETLSNTSR
jgi:hypothetical protein